MKTLKENSPNKELDLNMNPTYNNTTQVKSCLLFNLFPTLTLEQSDAADRTLRRKSRRFRWGREK